MNIVVKSFHSITLFLGLTATLCAQHVAVEPADVKNDGWVKRYEDSAKKMEEGNIDLLMIGDSITHGWEGQRELWDMYYGHRKAINLGISGDRTEHVLWRLDHLPLNKISPKAAMIMIGTNNVGHGSSNPKQASEGISEIVKRLQKAFPEMKILVLNVFPRGVNPDDKLRKDVDEINSYLPGLLKDEKNVTLLDINDKMLDKDGVLTKEIMPDALHPGTKGYGIWARAVEPTLSKLLGEDNPAVKPGDKMGEQWWRDRHNANVAQMEKGNIDLLMIGDSITHGWEGQRELWDQTFGQYKPINLGFGGDQTQHVLWRLDKLPLDKISPKGAEIMIGTNNVGNPHNTPYQIALGIKAIVEKLQKQYSNMKIIVLYVFPRAEKANDPWRLKVNEINACLPELLEEMKNVQLVDINDKFLDEDGTLPKSIMPDSLHPNAEGYKIWADAITPVLKSAMP